MEDEPIKGRKADFAELIAAATRGEWDFVDRHISSEPPTPEQIKWAKETGLKNEDRNIRDLAATLLDESNEPISADDQEELISQMSEDDYHIVRFRLAIALYKRGNRDTRVLAVMEEACKDGDVGELARSFM